MGSDSPIVRAFHESLYKSVVCIASRGAHSNARFDQCGTGVLLGFFQEKTRLKAIVATAGHVIQVDEHDEREWCLVRLATKTSPERSAVFQTGSQRTHDARITRYVGNDAARYDPGRAKLGIDIGLISFSNEACEGGFASLEEPLTPVIHERNYLTAGAAVAWAGYPSYLVNQLGRPFPCFFQGCISLAVNRPGAPFLYLVDGHNAYGTSGAPMWFWNDESGRCELAGLVCSYSAGEKRKDDALQFPGFVHVTPINHAVAFLSSIAQAPTTDGRP